MQASSLEETASSMEEIASTIKSSADNSVHGNEMMQDSEKSVKEAGSIIEETTNNIELVYEASNKITEITKIIESIASQTNILKIFKFVNFFVVLFPAAKRTKKCKDKISTKSY
ncbi:hypothetical protein [Brachyspira pulli]|uniref:hypothetical protein n=1 Tax=Brachyspira pulli TaxID=310721 RepID=UPI003AB0F6BE